jgi:hypothetical protein
MNRLVIGAALVAACAAGFAFDRFALAQQTGIKRTILLRTDDPAAASQEAVLGLAEIGPGASSGKHLHHGVEIGYVLDGSVVIEYPGKPATTYKAGEAFKNEGPHTARNPGATTAKVVAVYLVEKGKPLADPAP